MEKKISDADKKIPNTSGLFKKSEYNAKIRKIESKILSISELSTNSALTVVENKIPDVSSLVKTKKTNCGTKISEIEKKVTDHDHDKYITTSELTAKKLCCKISTSKFTNRDIF